MKHISRARSRGLGFRNPGFGVCVPRCKWARGFSLAEVAMALAISAFTLSVIFALLPVGLSSNKVTIEQTAAAGIARSIVADLRAVPPSDAGATSTGFKISIPSAGSDTVTTSTVFLCEDGTPVSSADTTSGGSTGNARYRSTVTFYPPALGRTATMVYLRISWPALVNASADGGGNYAGSFDATFSLDRN